MESQLTSQTYTVQPIPGSMSPVSPYALSNPVIIDAVYIGAQNKITVSLTFQIPNDVSASSVSVKQYYNSSQSSKLQFYICYSSASTAAAQTITCSFDASSSDGRGGSVDLGGITSVFNMLMNANGPKSSRGINTTIRITETKQ